MAQTALVTGATSGIGHEFAQQLAERGYDLVVVARDQQRLPAVAEELRTRYGVEVEALAADLTVPEQLALVEQRVGSTERPVDLLVNNAGFSFKQRFLDNGIDDEEAMLDVLVVAVLRLSHAALRAMTARGRGGIVNVSSVAAFVPRGTYGAAKSWVNAFTEWAHHEYRSRGVVVTALCPGFTKTEFHERMGVRRTSAPGFMWLDADRVVREGLADHAAGKAYSVPSRRYKAIVVLSRLIPSVVLHRAQSLGRR